jgi:murein DD-endopeptidase MepM/ murein hydrolase activator NlpD
MLRYLLVLLIGVLLGANVAWYVARSRQAPCPALPAAAQPVTAAPDTSPVASPPAVAPVRPAPAGTPQRAASGLVLPVAGIAPAQLVDTYTQSRSAGRVHEAIDIMAPAGTPVLAAVDGPVAKLFTSELGGLAIYQFDLDGRRVYYYAHLQGYAPGLHEGMEVRRGTVLGYVGSTGNADPGTPHLHFAVFRLGTPPKWWQGEAVNPYPFLRRAEPAPQLASR